MDLAAVGFVLMACLAVQCPAKTSGKEVRIEGKFMLGALFPIHYSKDQVCTTEINEQDGIQILEATVFALSKVNDELNKKDLSLGLIARDSCYETNVALQHALEFAERRYNSRSVRYDNCTCTSSISNNVIGVIGPPRSKETVSVANLLNLFQVPQISYFATTPELSDNVKYKYFKRTVPSDMYQARALVSLLSSLGWEFISIIYEDSNYGVEGYTQIMEAAEDAGICFGFDKKVRETTSDEEIKEVLDDLMKKKNTNGKVLAVLFMQYALAYRIIGLVNTDAKHVIWIGGDAWIGREPPSGLENVINGAIGISPKTQKYPGFAEYFKKLTTNNTHNPWFGEYLMQRYNCSTAKKSGCAKMNDFQELLTAYNVRNAVYAFGNAIDRIHDSLCGSNGVCDAMKTQLTGELLLQFLANVSDPYQSNFSFVKDRDGPVQYSVLQYQKTQWTETGTYNEDKLDWTSGNRPEQETSVCSLPCKHGDFRSRSYTCCWECRPCPYTDIVNETDPYNCRACGTGWTPGPLQNACVAIPVKHLEYDNPYVILIFVLSSIGIVLCSTVSVVFVFKRSTPIVKATGFETSLVLLVGILLSYISPFILVSEPSTASCAFFRIFLGLSYTMAYSSILSKLMVYNRAFDLQSSIKNKTIQGQPLLQRNICTMKTALVMTLTLSALHLFAIVFWIIGDNPVTVVSYSITRDSAIGNRSCIDLRNFSYFVSLGWSFLLMIACLIFALKTRKLPEGMNDSHEIMYCSFTSFILWITFIPLYAFSDNKVVKVMSLSIALIIHGTVCLLCLFVTKIYIVVFRPEKNNKERVMRTTPSRSRNSFSGSGLGSHAGEKRFSLALTLEDKTSTNASRKPSTACVADDTEEECEDYSATTGTLPFQNSVMIDRSEKFSEEAQAVLDCHVTSVNSGDKLLGNKDDQDHSDTMRTTKVNGNIPHYEKCDEDKLSPKDARTISNFQGSIGFKTPGGSRWHSSRKSSKNNASSEKIIEEERQQTESRRLSQSLPDVNLQNVC